MILLFKEGKKKNPTYLSVRDVKFSGCLRQLSPSVQSDSMKWKWEESAWKCQ